MVASVNAFATAYNQVTQALKDASAYDPSTKTGAILNGESTVQSLQNQIRSVLAAPVSGAAAGSSTFTLLSQVGVTVQASGLLGVDSAKLQGFSNLSYPMTTEFEIVIFADPRFTGGTSSAVAAEISALAQLGIRPGFCPVLSAVIWIGLLRR